MSNVAFAFLRYGLTEKMMLNHEATERNIAGM